MTEEKSIKKVYREGSRLKMQSVVIIGGGKWVPGLCLPFFQSFLVFHFFFFFFFLTTALGYAGIELARKLSSKNSKKISITLIEPKSGKRSLFSFFLGFS
jgi:hypothetical protein